MSRAPIAYSLGRPLEGEAGGAADLQTDIMRFMAILALCLMAIFALVQSLPDTPVVAESTAPEAPLSQAAEETADTPTPTAVPPAKAVVLTRRLAPAPKPPPEPVAVVRRYVAPTTTAAAAPPRETIQTESPPPATETEADGFTLRFESDLALSRLVAEGKVGFFALDASGAQRMSVAGSRLSFWSSPMPAQYHEMDAATVPSAVRKALSRTGRDGGVQRWAVTLPARLSGDLERLMQAHRGGALVIAKDGSLRREPT